MKLNIFNLFDKNTLPTKIETQIFPNYKIIFPNLGFFELTKNQDLIILTLLFYKNLIKLFLKVKLI